MDMRLSNYQRFIFIVLGIALLTSGCGKKASVEEPTAGPSIEGIDCSALELTGEDASPGQAVEILGLPEDVDSLVVEVHADDGDEVGFTVVERLEDEDGSHTHVIWAPFHPAAPIAGGQVRLRLVTEHGECGDWALEIAPLPQGPEVSGEFARTLDTFQRWLEHKAVQWGFDPTDLVGSPEDLAEHLAPFMTIQFGLDHPDNPNSLRRMIETGKVEIEGTTHEIDRALLDSVFAYLDLRGEIEREMAFQQQAFAELGIHTLRLPRHNELGRLVLGQVPIATAAQLDAMMFLQAQSQFLLEDKFGKVLETGSIVSTLLGVLVPPVGAGAGLAAWYLKLTLTLDAELLPSSFETIGYDLMPGTTLFEDDVNGGEWSKLEVSVNSRFFFMSRTMVEMVWQFISLRGAGKWVPDKLLNRMELAEQIYTAFAVEHIIKVLPLNGLKLGPYKWEDIDISDERYSESRLLPLSGGQALGFVQDGASADHHRFEVLAVGESTLALGTRSNRFGDLPMYRNNTNTRRSITIHTELGVPAIEVYARPPRTSVDDPGELVRVEVEVRNAHDTSITWEVLSGSATIERSRDLGMGFHAVDIRTSSSPDDFPILLAVTSSSRGGLRGKPDASPRLATVLIRYASVDVEIEPDDVCLEPGEVFTFTANVRGSNDTRVTWFATGGRIDASGRYTAPTGKGNYLVKATSAVDPEAIGEATVKVGDCLKLFVSGDLYLSASGLNAQFQQALVSRAAALPEIDDWQQDDGQWWRGDRVTLAETLNETFYTVVDGVEGLSPMPTEVRAQANYMGHGSRAVYELFSNQTITCLTQLELPTGDIIACPSTALEASWRPDYYVFVTDETEARVQARVSCNHDAGHNISLKIHVARFREGSAMPSFSVLEPERSCRSGHTIDIDRTVVFEAAAAGKTDVVVIMAQLSVDGALPLEDTPWSAGSQSSPIDVWGSFNVTRTTSRRQTSGGDGGSDDPDPPSGPGTPGGSNNPVGPGDPEDPDDPSSPNPPDEQVNCDEAEPFSGQVFINDASSHSRAQGYSRINGTLIIGEGTPMPIHLPCLQAVTEALTISSVPGLTRVTGLGALVEVKDLIIAQNPDLLEPGDFSSLRTITGSLIVMMNPALKSLNDLSALTSVGASFSVQNNAVLPTACAEALRDQVGLVNIGGTILISGNANGPCL
jgi:hypothetical protein